MDTATEKTFDSVLFGWVIPLLRKQNGLLLDLMDALAFAEHGAPAAKRGVSPSRP